jgi:serine/threonine protein kinase
VGRQVAVKVIGERVSRSRAGAKRFLREARLASRLSHPNIVTIHDFGQADNELLYIVMEHLTGRTLADVVHQDGPLSVDRALAIGEQLCNALHTAHSSEIVHRDLKPANIIVTDHADGSDHVKVLDFGIAKSLAEGSGTTLTESGQLLGTPGYMAPEVISGGVVNARSDLYSLGVVLGFVLTGELPRDGDASLPSHLPDPLREVITRLLDPDPRNRYASALEVRQALRVGAETGAIETTPHTGPAPPRSHRLLLLAAGLVVVTALATYVATRPRSTSRVSARSHALTTDAGVGTSTEETSLSVDAGTPSSDAIERPRQVTFQIEATPPARLWVDGVDKGRTPRSFSLPRSADSVVVELRRKGYKTWKGRLSRLRDQQINRRLHRLRSRGHRPSEPKTKTDDDQGFIPP